MLKGFLRPSPLAQPKPMAQIPQSPGQRQLFSADFKSVPIPQHIMFIVKGNPNTYEATLQQVIYDPRGDVSWIHLLCDGKILKMEAHAWDSHVIAYDLDNKTK